MMPGYLVTPPYTAVGVPLTPTGDVAATNVQDGIAELSSEKATVSSVTTVQNNVNTVQNNVTTVQNNLNTVNSNLSAQISSVEGVALLGL